EGAARSSGACPRRKPGDPRAVPQPAHRHRPVSRVNSALRERRVQTYSCRLLLNFDLLRSPSGSPWRAQAGTWLGAPRAEWALPFSTWRRPRSILYADLPRCGAEPWARAKAVSEVRKATATPGPEGPYGHRPRATAERQGACGLRPGLRAALSYGAGRRRPRGAVEGQGPEEQRWWWQLILPQGDVASRRGHQAALSPGLRAPAGGVLRKPYRPAFSPRTRRPQRQSLHQRQPRRHRSRTAGTKRNCVSQTARILQRKLRIGVPGHRSVLGS
ncbi:hypothetical protein LEMLEM_LOCUS25097, partial [Lemmus lemmus]